MSLSSLRFSTFYLIKWTLSNLTVQNLPFHNSILSLTSTKFGKPLSFYLTILLFQKFDILSVKIPYWYFVTIYIFQILAFVRAFLFAFGGIKAAKHFHKRLLNTILKAPISFFDVTPVRFILFVLIIIGVSLLSLKSAGI